MEMPPFKIWLLLSHLLGVSIPVSHHLRHGREHTPLEVSAAVIPVEGRMIFLMSNEEMASAPSPSAGSFPRRVKVLGVFGRSTINLCRARFINTMRISNRCDSDHLNV